MLDHLVLIKDVKQSHVTQYVRKTLAKKRLSSEKSSEVAPGRGGDKGTTSAADRRDGQMSGPVPSSLQNYKVSSHFNPLPTNDCKSHHGMALRYIKLCVNRKGGTWGGGWGHPEGEHGMV